MIITRTPYRISFFGGGTDYPAWYKENGGAVLSTTIDKYCYLTVRHLPPYFEHKHRIVYSQIENVLNIDEIHHEKVRECMRHMGIQQGLEIHHDGDLPARSGIGTSSSFTVGLLHALFTLLKKPMSKLELALEAIYVEQDIIKEHVGCQDQIAAAIGGFNLIKFSNNKHPSVKALDIPSDYLEKFQTHLLLVFTGFPHCTADMIAKTYDFNKKYELTQLLQITAEACELIHTSPVEVGKLLHQSWELKRKLSDQITTPYIDYIYGKALSAGAIGGKLLGAGNGGFMLLLVEPEKQGRVREALQGLLFIPFKFENKGSQVIFNDTS